MKRYAFLVLPVLLSTASYCLADEGTKEKNSGRASTLKYSDPAGDRYLTLQIFRDGNIVRALHGEIERGGAFDYEESPLASSDGHFILINQIESAKLETPNGPIITNRAYCSIVDVRSGCIVARDTGQFCGGAFTSDGEWKTPVYPDLNLSATAPKAKAFVKGQLRPADSPETSFDNLLACDQPDSDNADAYHTIMEENIFDLDSAQREALLRDLSQLRI